MLPARNSAGLVKSLGSFSFDRPVKLMEVCGTHTMAIAKAGIKQLLPKNVELISGPGCPVCVTPAGRIDEILALSHQENVIIATYGDMIRVPGSIPGSNLRRAMAAGAEVRVVYSPLDAVRLAGKLPENQVVFLGVGFETTAPGTAIAIETARDMALSNFSVFSLLKTVEPALRALISAKDFDIDGFLCPGHVATIVGEGGFRFLPGEYNLPAVISGFEPEDILASLIRLLTQIRSGAPRLENEYLRGVSAFGNLPAQQAMSRVFYPCDGDWRGLGLIRGSTLAIRDEFSQFDAARRYNLGKLSSSDSPGCRCGEIIRGRLQPKSCPLFGTVCKPDEPVGPCMVSGEGACAAAYKYQTV